MWTHYEPTISPNNLNLDQIFSFLQEERVLESKGAKNENKTLDEITDELNELNTLLSEDMVRKVMVSRYYYFHVLLLLSYKSTSL